MTANSCKLIVISIGFLLLFSVFMTAQSLAAEVLDDLGFGDLGFYSLGLLYFTFSFCSFIATPLVNKCGERFSMTLGSIWYFLYISSFAFASASIKYEDNESKILEKSSI